MKAMFNRLLSSLQFTCKCVLTTQSSRLMVPPSLFKIPQTQTRCYSSIFGQQSLDLDQLWIGVTGAPGKQKKRARGKRRVTRPKVDLRRGQRIGMGKSKLYIPALVKGVFDKSGHRIAPIQSGTLETDEYNKRLLQLRSKLSRKRERLKLPPLLRGWTSKTMSGRSEGPPDRVMESTFEGFDTKVIEMKTVSHMTATKGRTPSFSCFAVTGNGKGLAGYALSKSTKMFVAIDNARNKCGQRLVAFNLRDNGRTLWHPAFEEMHKTKIIAYPTRPGSGVHGDKIIQDICKLVGIKDIYVYIEGSRKNYGVITKAFFELLRNQQNYQDLANETHLHVVEFDEELDGYPRVLASPASGITGEKDSQLQSETGGIDLSYYFFGGKVPYIRAARLPGFLFAPLRLKRVRERNRFRNQWTSFIERQRVAELHPDVPQPPRRVPPGQFGIKWSRCYERLNRSSESS